jgi:hypothetical protein
VFGTALFLAGCASSPKGEVVVRPSPSTQPTHQVVGDAIIASMGGAAVTVQWLPAPGIEQYYVGKPGLVNPFPPEDWKETPPTIFFVRVRNQTPEAVQFDPALISLVTQSGWRERPMAYEEMYMRLSEMEGAGARLRSLEATLLSRFIVVQPGGQREGLLVFPALDPDAKHLSLEFVSFFIGGRAIPSLFEFQVLRQETK